MIIIFNNNNNLPVYDLLSRSRAAHWLRNTDTDKRLSITGGSAHPNVCAELLDFPSSSRASKFAFNGFVKRAAAKDFLGLVPVSLLLLYCHHLHSHVPQ